MQQPHPGSPFPVPRTPSPTDVVFTADFASTEQWVEGRSWAYPGGGPVNPDDDKLDYLVTDPSYCRTGLFRAVRRRDGRWNTGLLTTEGSDQSFMVRSGDVLEARVRLPREVGAWPAIWTWRDGGQEIDVFEYHPDNPNLLEFGNHVRDTGSAFRGDAVRPGAWIDLRTEFGAESVVWWVNGTRAFADRRGVGRRWHAYLIVNLSVCAGRYHPAPAPATREMSYEVSGLLVRRPAPAGGKPHALHTEDGDAPAVPPPAAAGDAAALDDATG